MFNLIPDSITAVGQATTAMTNDTAAFQADLEAFKRNTDGVRLPALALGSTLGWYTSDRIKSHLALKGLGLSLGAGVVGMGVLWNATKTNTLKDVSPTEVFLLNIPGAVGMAWTVIGLWRWFTKK